MVITVVDLGESCANPDKYLQAISAGTMSQNGVPMDENIIIKLDWPLLGALFCTLIGFITVIMSLITYCLHQQWRISKIKRSGYRLDNADLDIKHSSKEMYDEKSSDFERLPSNCPDSSSGEEDDVDDINMDIYQDLVEAGKKFLDTYNDAADARRHN